MSDEKKPSMCPDCQARLDRFRVKVIQAGIDCGIGAVLISTFVGCGYRTMRAGPPDSARLLEALGRVEDKLVEAADAMLYAEEVAGGEPVH